VGSSRKSTAGEDHAGGQIQAPAHATGVLGDGPAAGLGEVECVEQLGRPAGRVPGGQVVEPGEELQVLPAGEHIVDGRMLADQADPLADSVRPRHHVEPGHFGPAAVRPEQRGQDSHGRRLPGAVAAEQAVHCPLAHGQVEPVQGGRVAIQLAQFFDNDHDTSIVRCTVHITVHVDG
jgi:hypothetical protein